MPSAYAEPWRGASTQSRRRGSDALGRLRSRRSPASGASSSPSPVAPTRRSSPPSRRECSEPSRCCARPPSPPRSRPRTGTTAPAWQPSGACAGWPSTTHELDDPAYVRNDLDRCYHCKRELMDVLAPSGRVRAGDRRARASTSTTSATTAPARRRPPSGAPCFPLVQAGLDKATVRAGLAGDRAAHLGPPGGGVPRVEGSARHAGQFRGPGAGGDARNRACGGSASPLCGSATTATSPGSSSRWRTWAARSSIRDEIVAAVRGAGYRYVTLDLEGLRSGNLSRAAASERRQSPMSTRVRLTFPEELVREPIVAQLVRRFDVEPNIRRASVEAHEGWLICELDGDSRRRSRVRWPGSRRSASASTGWATSWRADSGPELRPGQVAGR